MRRCLLFAAGMALLLAPALADDKAPALKYNDGKAEGKMSLGGSGQMVEFTLPAGTSNISGLKIHGSRYGTPQAPDEKFLIFFLDPRETTILHTEMAPYALFERGDEKWVTVSFPKPVNLPSKFWVALDFRPTQRKGVYVSYDSSGGGKHSRVGLPGIKGSPTTRGGDWMIELIPAK